MDPTGDKIRDLPVDNPDHKSRPEDLELVSTLFRNKEHTSTLFKEFKDSLIGGLLFIILSLKVTDKFLEGFCENTITRYIVKFCIFVILFYIIKNRFN